MKSLFVTSFSIVCVWFEDILDIICIKISKEATTEGRRRSEKKNEK